MLQQHHDIVSAVNISADTPQAQLCKLTEAATRAHMLSALPITGRGLRTMLLFILFPGMIFGFWKGLILTGIATIGMVIAIALDDPSISVAITRAYFIWGAITAIGVACSVMVAAIREAKRRRQYIIPLREGEHKAELIYPQQEPLHITSLENAFLAEVEFEAPAQGVYAFIIELEHCDWASAPMLQDKRHACILEWRNKERPESLFCAYRLEAGIHQISMKMGVVKRSTGRPKAKLSQINKVH